MERLTKNKDVSEMGMAELAHNSCYAKEGNATYRDYDLDIDARKLARKLLKDYAGGDDAFTDDEDFDERMIEYLSYGMNNIEGFIALFYRNLWAQADLYETLKYYEDLKEQGLLPELRCKVGDIVYSAIYDCVTGEKYISESTVEDVSIKGITFADDFVLWEDFGKVDFLIRAEAEKALAEMEGTE